MKMPSIRSVLSRLIIKHPILNKPAIHGDREPESNNIWMPPFLSGGSWYQPLLKSLYSLPNRIAVFFVGLIDDSYDFVQKHKDPALTTNTGEYENRKHEIIKQLNIFQLLTGIIVPVSVFFSQRSLPFVSALIFVFPPLINFLVLYLDAKHKKLEAMIAYFALYPFFTNLAYIDSFSLGTELFFVLYAILSVFFLQQAANIVFCIGFNMVNYLMLIVMLKRYQTPHDDNHPFFFLLNHVVAVLIIFYSLYLIKKENAGYQASILEKNNELLLINEEVKKQKEEIAEKARLLEEQAIRLNKIDAFKNRLFSIVSHDLKAPLHALKNLFAEIKQQNLPAEEIIDLVPDVIKDLNYATWLTENLLNWAKTQMHAEAMHPHNINVNAMVEEVIQQQRLQAELKDIRIKKAIKEEFFIYADSDMVKLVVRNILSNAIKFTPQGGRVTIGTNAVHAYVEIFVEDTGGGMDAEALNKIRMNDYFTTRGTANEQGTGLGLMLCKEFLEKNKGQLHIESKKGKGSVFSFTLPRVNN